MNAPLSKHVICAQRIMKCQQREKGARKSLNNRLSAPNSSLGVSGTVLHLAPRTAHTVYTVTLSGREWVRGWG